MPIQSYDIAQQIQVGPQDLSVGSRAIPRGGRTGESVMAEVWGKYGELCANGYVFVARVAAAAAVPVDTTLTNAPAIWNKTSSGKTVIPLKIMFSVGAIGTPILNGFTLSYLTGAGDAVATAAPVVTWTNVAPKNLKLGGPSATTLFAPAVSTYTTNPSPLMDLGLGHHLEGTAASGQLYTLSFDFDSMIQMPPGSTLHVGSTIATSTTYWTSIVFAEIPLLSA
ncbi:MAG: hypothetical protein WC455_16060 [Dehalococcoidia bacterium]|jgi:hypothetical protein